VDGLSGTPGTRQNMQGATSSAWKFQTNGNQEFGDVSVTNVSVFTFRLQTVHYDARRGATNSPMNLDLIYLATGSNLVRSDNGVEIADNAIVEAISFGSPLILHSHRSITLPSLARFKIKTMGLR
jgi:hypothetical protein